MTECSCSSNDNQKKRILYSCSGAADVGQIADLTARRLAKNKLGAMSCMAGIGANLSGYIETAKEADNIIIDGCPVGCGKKMFESHNLPFTEIVLTEQGLVKGSTPATPEVVERMADTITASLAAR